MRLYFTICAVALLFFSLPTSADPINQVSYNNLQGNEFVDFENISGGTPIPPAGIFEGRYFTGLLNAPGMTIGERFAGQALNTDTVEGVDFDSLPGEASGPLSVLPGATAPGEAIPSKNLIVVVVDNDRGLSGLGPEPLSDAPTVAEVVAVIGEGSIAILFTFDQSEFGFRSRGGNGGAAVFHFFRRDGSLIATLTPDNLGSDLFGFSRENGVQDIAGISIHSFDDGGIGLDDIRFDVGERIFNNQFE